MFSKLLNQSSALEILYVETFTFLEFVFKLFFIRIFFCVFQAGEKQTYKMIGNIPDKDMSMLEERIKRASKSRPPPGGPVAAAAPAPVQEPEPVAPPPATTG